MQRGLARGGDYATLDAAGSRLGSLPAVSSLGVRPTIETGRVLLETRSLARPERLGRESAYGRLINVELVK